MSQLIESFVMGFSSTLSVYNHDEYTTSGRRAGKNDFARMSASIRTLGQDSRKVLNKNGSINKN
jgi:hypothetical protein